MEAAGLGRTVREDLIDALDTIVGERGITPLRRSEATRDAGTGLIRDAKVLLLDDCFSSVDTETEEQILSGLQRMRGDKTTILISHRVSTARHANRIYVIDNGRVLETGTHQELLAKDGYYAELEAVQSNQELDRSRKSALLHNLEVDDDALVQDEGNRDGGTGGTHERRRQYDHAGAQLRRLRPGTDAPGAQRPPVPAAPEVDQALPPHAHRGVPGSSSSAPAWPR